MSFLVLFCFTSILCYVQVSCLPRRTWLLFLFYVTNLLAAALCTIILFNRFDIPWARTQQELVEFVSSHHFQWFVAIGFKFEQRLNCMGKWCAQKSEMMIWYDFLFWYWHVQIHHVITLDLCDMPCAMAMFLQRTILASSCEMQPQNIFQTR